MKAASALSLLFSILLISGCAGGSSPLSSPLTPPSVSAATAVPFGGRYLFHAEMHTDGISDPRFVEGGILSANGNGGFTLIGTYNQNVDIPGTSSTGSNISSPNVNVIGSYTLDSAGATVVIPAISGATDAFSSSARAFCRHDGSYCTIVSTEALRPWQGKLWRDDSSPTAILSTSEVSGRYIFESDASFNKFVESGVVTFDGAGKYTLESDFNAYDGSVFSQPGQPWACGVYSANSNFAHMTQSNCATGAVTDTYAMYCLNDASRCIAVPDMTEEGSWIAEFQRQ